MAATSSSCRTFLVRYPAAPALSDCAMSSGVSDDVSMSTRASGAAARSRRIVSMPSMPCMLTSSRQTSGLCACQRTTAASPSSAWATTVKSRSSASRLASPARITGWSSTSIRRMRWPAGMVACSDGRVEPPEWSVPWRAGAVYRVNRTTVAGSSRSIARCGRSLDSGPLLLDRLDP